MKMKENKFKIEIELSVDLKIGRHLFSFLNCSLKKMRFYDRKMNWIKFDQYYNTGQTSWKTILKKVIIL